MKKLGEERRYATKVKAEKLLKIGFVKEASYVTWLANVVLVKKASGKWRMCVDFTNLIKVCQKKTYMLPIIDRLVDGVVGHNILSFFYAYPGYSQISMEKDDKMRIAFITEEANYYYEVMPLKNVEATYQRLMARMFKHLIRKKTLKYMLTTWLSSAPPRPNILKTHLKSFQAIHAYNLCLNQ